MSHKRRVLIIGLDPRTIPGLDVAAALAGLEYGLSRFAESNLEADECLVPLDATAESRILAALDSHDYDCVVLGGGIRKPDQLVAFLEVVVNLVRAHAPRAVIAFNTDGGTSLDAASRVLG